MEHDKLRMEFSQEMDNNIEITEWLKNEVLRCYDKATGTEDDNCPLCGDGCNCKGGA